MTNADTKIVKGIYMAIATAAMLAVNDVLIRALLPKLPFYELIFIRSVFIIMFLMFLSIIKKERLNLISYLKGNFLLRFLRAVSLALSGLLFFYAALIIPIASATALALGFPILVSVFAKLFLKEQISKEQCCYLVLGFLGSLCIVQPSNFLSGDYNFLACIAAAAAGFSLSIYFVTTRHFSKTMTAIRLTIEPQFFLLLISIIIYHATEAEFFALDGSSGHIQALLAPWKYPQAGEFLLLSILCINGVGLFFLTVKSYELAQATIIAPFEFFIIPLTMIMAFLVMNEIPNLLQIIGANMVFLALFQIKRYRSH